MFGHYLPNKNDGALKTKPNKKGEALCKSPRSNRGRAGWVPAQLTNRALARFSWEWDLLLVDRLLANFLHTPQFAFFLEKGILF